MTDFDYREIEIKFAIELEKGDLAGDLVRALLTQRDDLYAKIKRQEREKAEEIAALKSKHDRKLSGLLAKAAERAAELRNANVHIYDFLGAVGSEDIGDKERIPKAIEQARRQRDHREQLLGEASAHATFLDVIKEAAGLAQESEDSEIAARIRQLSRDAAAFVLADEVLRRFARIARCDLDNLESVRHLPQEVVDCELILLPKKKLNRSELLGATIRAAIAVAESDLDWAAPKQQLRDLVCAAVEAEIFPVRPGEISPPPHEPAYIPVPGDETDPATVQDTQENRDKIEAERERVLGEALAKGEVIVPSDPASEQEIYAENMIATRRTSCTVESDWRGKEWTTGDILAASKSVLLVNYGEAFSEHVTERLAMKSDVFVLEVSAAATPALTGRHFGRIVRVDTPPTDSSPIAKGDRVRVKTRGVVGAYTGTVEANESGKVKVRWLDGSATWHKLGDAVLADAPGEVAAVRFQLFGKWYDGQVDPVEFENAKKAGRKVEVYKPDGEKVWVSPSKMP